MLLRSHGRNYIEDKMIEPQTFLHTRLFAPHEIGAPNIFSNCGFFPYSSPLFLPKQPKGVVRGHRGVLTAVTCHILPIFVWFLFTQAPRPKEILAPPGLLLKQAPPICQVLSPPVFTPPVQDLQFLELQVLSIAFLRLGWLMRPADFVKNSTEIAPRSPFRPALLASKPAG